MSTDRKTETRVETPPEQLVYANVLFWGCWGGLAVLCLTYLLYVTGLVAPHVPLDQVTSLWSQPVKAYLTQGRVPTGWGWFGLLGQGDFLNFVGIALLAGLTIFCYLPIIPVFLKRKNRTYALVALAEVLVLIVAASGLVGAGAH